MPNDDMRSLTETERAILEKLIAAAPDHYAALRSQIDSCRVRVCDEFGSLEIEVSDKSHPIAVTTGRPIAEAVQEDGDISESYGPLIEVLLFARDGFIYELQIYKGNGTPIKSRLDASKLRVLDR